MAPYSEVLKWQETMNGVTIDCSLEIAVHPAKSNVILLTVPGVDGSVDGYENKYVRIADSIQEQHGAAVVRMANPFITSFHWESNVRRALEYIAAHAVKITGSEEYEMRIMAHSAGAAIVARIAHEYPCISRLLLINTATKLGRDSILIGISEFKGDQISVVYGDRDPCLIDYDIMFNAGDKTKTKSDIVKDADHNFSGPAMIDFLDMANIHLFS